MKQDERGIYDKFLIARMDDRDKPGEKHHGCCYFILDLNHDPHVWEALRGYARACADTRPQLSRDIEATIAIRTIGNGLSAALHFFRGRLRRGGDAKWNGVTEK